MRIASRRPAEAPPPRMGELAKLPVFLDLAGKRAIVAGSSAAAAWKAELLAAAGAHVEVYARAVVGEMRALIERGAASGTLIHMPRPWAVDCFTAAAIAICDAEDRAEARSFYCAARAAGVPVNVIDKPEFCTFQLGSIVNRSPVVIGISTDGAAPILAQAIRRRVEMLLPASLAAWGRIAKDIRSSVSGRLAPGQPRRRFWEAFAERAFGPPPEANAREEAVRVAQGIADAVEGTSKGRVTLVGAGPGDVELLTLKAVRALQSADVILYDDLVADEVLELARREARRIRVGKRARQESCVQGDINELMLELAQQGRHVVRLKSGDPMIFGRAGEEIARLEAAGIAVTVVPGITAASSMAARLGLSLTHRECAHSVRFVTGHSCTGELPEGLDWKGLADPETTLVVYMGGQTVRGIAARLSAEGLPISTPAVAVSSVSREDEKRWHGTLGDLLRSGLPDGLGNPVLIGIGAVFDGRERGNCPRPVREPVRHPEVGFTRELSLAS